MDAIKSDQGLLQFVLLRKVRTFDDVRETCLDYAEHQKIFFLPKKLTGNASGVLDIGAQERQQGTDKHALDKMDMLRKKFENLALLIKKNKPKPNIQDIICYKRKKPGHYASQCQMHTEVVKSCNYCGRYGHSETACCKKQADEAGLRNHN